MESSTFARGGCPPGIADLRGTAMKLVTGIAALAAAAPLAVLAQVVYQESPRVLPAPDYMPPGLYDSCVQRQDTLARRRADLEQRRASLDAENERITREGHRLAGELRSLNAQDVAAVNAYNERQQRFNQWVNDHNRRAADMNDAAASMNTDAQYMLNDCVPRGFVWRDRDWWERDRTYWRDYQPLR